MRIKRHGHALVSVIALAAPTTVSPTTATEQKHHQQNDQYGFHLVPHLYEEAELAFVTAVTLLLYNSS
jgi:hypothetical protein